MAYGFIDWITDWASGKSKKEQEAQHLYFSNVMNEVANSLPENATSKLQDALWKAGAFKGVKDRHGKEATYLTAVDGISGNMTRTAIANAKKAGYKVDLKTGIISRIGPEPSNMTVVKREGNGVGTKFGENKPQKKGGLAAMREMTHAARTGGMSITPPVLETSNDNQSTGHAIYLHYPNFVGKSANALKIGDFDLGELIGNPDVPVGHSAFILVDNNGNSNYYEYGRYTANSGNVIGKEKRPTVKGGNWRRIALPRKNTSESDSIYMSRILLLLPDTKTGAYLAMTIPDVDVLKSTEYILKQADDPNRPEYSIFNTCATGACNAVLPFRKNKNINLSERYNTKGYSTEAKLWGLLPFTTDNYARNMRTAASDVYVMNVDKKQLGGIFEKIKKVTKALTNDPTLEDKFVETYLPEYGKTIMWRHVDHDRFGNKAYNDTTYNMLVPNEETYRFMQNPRTTDYRNYPTHYDMGTYVLHNRLYNAYSGGKEEYNLRKKQFNNAEKK